MSLKIRFSLVIGTLVLAIVGLTTGILYWSERNFLIAEAASQQEETVSALAQVARESYLSQDDLMLINYTASLGVRLPELSFAYVAEPGRVLAHTRRELAGTDPQKLPEPPAGTTVVRLPVERQGQADAHAIGGFSRAMAAASVEKALRNARRRMAVVAVSMVAGGLLASLALAASLTRPISDLAAAASRLGQGRLDTRLEVRRSDELGLLASRFNETAGKLQELDEMKKDFVSAVTHELKSPLAAIESYLALILFESKDKRGEDRWLEDISAIRGHTARLSNFVTDLLDLAKLERGSFNLNRVPVRPEAVAEEVVEFMTPLAAQGGVALSVEAQAGGGPIPADPERLRQVLINLVSNALKFTPSGGKVIIELGLSPQGGEILCAVRDTGIGIAQADLARIFEKFEQVRSSRPIARGPKGTGLGLAICRSIVEAHGGRIWVESEPGRGSRFLFTLPSRLPAETGREVAA